MEEQHSGSPEFVAYLLTKMTLNSYKQCETHDDVLDLYAECLLAAQGRRAV